MKAVRVSEVSGTSYDAFESEAHVKDSDCTVVDGVCIECGVGHGEPCTGIIFKLGDLCMGRGFHRPGCLDSDATFYPWAPDGNAQFCFDEILSAFRRGDHTAAGTWARKLVRYTR